MNGKDGAETKNSRLTAQAWEAAVTPGVLSVVWYILSLSWVCSMELEHQDKQLRVLFFKPAILKLC